MPNAHVIELWQTMNLCAMSASIRYIKAIPKVKVHILLNEIYYSMPYTSNINPKGIT